MKRALVLLAGFAATAVALLAGFEAAAQDGTLKKIKDSGSITIGHRDASIPFSYYDDRQQPVGYAVDLCMRIVDAVKSGLKMPNLKVNYQLVETGRAVAFVMDDILLYSLAAQSRSPRDYAISEVALSVEPYGIMLRKDDAAFKKVVDAAMVDTYRSGAINAIYDKWFLKPVPPKGLNLNVPMSEPFRKVIANPTDSGDPAAYK